jgi:3-dehydroquinate synthase class II
MRLAKDGYPDNKVAKNYLKIIPEKQIPRIGRSHQVGIDGSQFVQEAMVVGFKERKWFVVFQQIESDFYVGDQFKTLFFNVLCAYFI